MNGLEAKEGQTEIVTDVGMGQKDAVEGCAVDAALHRPADVAESVELVADVRGGVDEIDLAAGGQNQSETGDATAAVGVTTGDLTIRTAAGGVWEPAILNRTDDTDKWAVDWAMGLGNRGRRCRFVTSWCLGRPSTTAGHRQQEGQSQQLRPPPGAHRSNILSASRAGLEIRHGGLL
jgi:hypothetical protein